MTTRYDINYKIVDKKGVKKGWIKLGSAFPAKDGLGIVGRLDAIPTNAWDGTFVLYPSKPSKIDDDDDVSDDNGNGR